MKDLLFNVNSVEVSYGDDVLNSVIRIDERISDLNTAVSTHEPINDFEKREWHDRIDKLVVLNEAIRKELERQVERLQDLRSGLDQKAILRH